MALFDLSAKKGPTSQSQMPSVPVQQVASLKQQGMSDSQIIQVLQRDGYKSHQIFDAMNQAELVSGAPRPLDDLPPESQQLQQPPQYPPQYAQQAYPAQFTDQPEPMLSPSADINYDRMEEIAESIIEEKWVELSKGIAKIIEWKERTEQRVNELDTRITQLRESMDEISKSLFGKMGEYDKNMSVVGSDIKAMEKVFQQMLPSFTENVNELSRLTRNLKK